MSDAIGDRFKRYEACFDYSLPRRLPMVIRVDGRAFHGLPLVKPFDSRFHLSMCNVALALCKEVQGAVLAYLQSDEISVIARDDFENTTQPWFDKRLSKILSLSAAIATAAFNADVAPFAPRQFDARAFVLPDLNEVCNYLIWRQQDATRNSVSMAAHAAFSHKSLQGVDTNGMLNRLRDAGQPWENTMTHFKRGAIAHSITVLREVPETGETCERRQWIIDREPPIFTADRDYVTRLWMPPVRDGDADGICGTVKPPPARSSTMKTKAGL